MALVCNPTPLPYTPKKARKDFLKEKIGHELNLSFHQQRPKFLFKIFLFCIGVEPINNVVKISGEQQRDPAMHLWVFVLLQTPLSSRLPYNIEQSSTY